MVNDPIGDLLIQIKNASMVGKLFIDVPYSRLKHAVAAILCKEGYIGDIGKTGVDPKALLHIVLKYESGTSVITNMKRISKPGLRQYVNRTTIPTVLGGAGLSVVSTPQGVMTGKDAKKKGIGGELLCTIW